MDVEVVPDGAAVAPYGERRAPPAVVECRGNQPESGPWRLTGAVRVRQPQDHRIPTELRRPGVEEVLGSGLAGAVVGAEPERSCWLGGSSQSPYSVSPYEK